MNMKKDLPCEMVRRDIEELIIERKLTVDTLSRITKINHQWFIDFISQKKNIKKISEYDIRFLTDLTSILKMGIDFDCDSRLKAIIETLIIEYKMDTKTLSLCSGANEDVMCRFLSNTNLVSAEEKYELAVRIMFIYFVFKFPYYEKY